MKKKFLILLCLIALIFSMAGVSAVDVNQTIFSDTPILENADGGSFTELQDKINNAEDGSTISLENNYTYDTSFKGEYISIAKNITVDGNGYTIDAKNASGIFNISATNVVLNNIVFVNAVSYNGIGSAIYSNGVLNIINSRFMDSISPIYSESNLTIINSSFERNINDYDGGAIYSAGSLTVRDSNFINNLANYGRGGAIYSSGDLTVISCNFIENNILDWDCGYGVGGSIYSNGLLNVVNSSFTGNFAEEGGAIYSDGSLLVEASNFTDNVAHWMGGGAIYANGDLIVGSSNFIGNDAPDWDHQGNIGGAIYSLSYLNVTYSYFANNTAGSVGEKVNNAIYAYAAYASIENSTFINNDVALTKFSSGFDLNLNSSAVPVGQSVMISVEFYNKNIPGNVTIHINDDEKVVDIVNGSASLMLSDLAPGTYLVNVIYPESEYWWESFETAKFNVFDGSYVIDAPDLLKYYGGSERFVVNIYDTGGEVISGKRIIINIDGRDYARTTDDDGRASVAINLNSGKHHAIVKCDDSSINSSITVKSTVSGENITKIFRNATQYYAKFVDTYGNILNNTPVEFNINGILYTRTTNASGVAKLNINLNPGEYIITAKNPNSTEMHSNLVTVLPNIVENNNLIKYYGNASQYVIKVLDNLGNPAGADENVTFNINGVFYKRMTNETGHAKLNINLNPGEYIITADYKGMMVSNTIKVLSVIEARDLKMAYGDGSKFEARILDGQGNPYPGQNVTFNINGVFYNRTADVSGIARLNINLMAGEYIITSSYNGLNVANKITIV
ncbi:hypothetical protein [uncultured Methanobrevibacter sp.]|uniref:hypothetical protein n=1 Tax=uncultured Methanobrevibacter sp. TaxID=253161 RepID=UPI0025D78A8C|nr:hypothetical protein [uncultured Methanobrevibacter sp.]